MIAWSGRFNFSESPVLYSLGSSTMMLRPSWRLSLGSTALDGGLHLNSADFPGRFFGADGSVLKTSVVVEHAAVVVLTEGQNVHQTNSATGVLDDSTVDFCEFVVENKANFTGGLGQVEHVSNDERDRHAKFERVSTGRGSSRPRPRSFSWQGPAFGAWPSASSGCCSSHSTPVPSQFCDTEAVRLIELRDHHVRDVHWDRLFLVVGLGCDLDTLNVQPSFF